MSVLAACAPQIREGGAPAALIELVGINKSFGPETNPTLAVRDVSLRVYPGEFVTIVGPSACGKSTLLNMTAGLMRPTSGTVLYGGAPVRDVNLRTGYMTQTDHLLPWRTVAQNVSAPLELRGTRRAEARERVRGLLDLVGLTEFAAAYPSQISGGMRKRTVLARLLAYDPETLLMDEPFSALDAQLRVALQVELRDLARRLRKTVLFVTHDLDEAVALGDRCIVFTARPGTIKAEIEIPLSRDRDLVGLRFDPENARVCAELWRLLADENAFKGGRA